MAPELIRCLGPEMKSTGEVMGIASRPLAWRLQRVRFRCIWPASDVWICLYLSFRARDKESAWRSARELANLNFKIYAQQLVPTNSFPIKEFLVN
jgi:hypothetical protein